MASRYIPPHMKKSQDIPPSLQNVDQEKISDATAHDPSMAYRSRAEIERYFWPDTDVTFRGEGSATLHASHQEPNVLSYVLLFAGAHPRWNAEGIIFCKSNLELLPVETSDGSIESRDSGTSAQPPQPVETARSHPIAVFQQRHTIRRYRHLRDFEFQGWYKVARLAFLEPHSAELKRMLEQKWTLPTADGEHEYGHRKRENWAGSLRKRWAVIKFEKDEQANKEREQPRIRQLDKSGREIDPAKGVTKLLRELRLEDGKVKEESNEERKELTMRDQKAEEESNDEQKKETEDVEEERANGKMDRDAGNDTKTETTIDGSHTPDTKT